MAFDIHLSKPGSKDVSSTCPVTSLDIHEHATLFCQNKELLPQFFNMNGMSNYYGDVVYSGDEILELKLELAAMAEQLSENETACAIIARIDCIVDRAIREKSAIYCFGE